MSVYPHNTNFSGSVWSLVQEGSLTLEFVNFELILEALSGVCHSDLGVSDRSSCGLRIWAGEQLCANKNASPRGPCVFTCILSPETHAKHK